VSRPGPLSERAVILAPQGRDAEVAVMILKEAGFPANIASNLAELCDEIASGAGLAIMTDQAIHEVDLRPLVAWLKSQPPWSDFPIVLLTRHGGGVERNPTALRLADVLGNVIFVERPFHPTTLTSVVQTAVRSTVCHLPAPSCRPASARSTACSAAASTPVPAP
jgi:DNA-binding NtrC family response regulator